MLSLKKFSKKERLPKRMIVDTGHSNLNNALQHTATHCNTLQHTATHCNALQHTATHCNALHILQHTATHCTYCSTLQHTATHCNALHILQHTATHCNTQQHTATHCNTQTERLPKKMIVDTGNTNSNSQLYNSFLYNIA